MKSLFTSDHLLVYYDPDLELILACDASPYGVGTVLSHRGEDVQEKPITFASRILALTKKNYSQLEKEGQATVFGVKKFHPYLFECHFVILSDHKPLRHLFKEDSAIPVMVSAHWALLLGGYDYNLEKIMQMPTSLAVCHYQFHLEIFPYHQKL